jgi:hypothetical protein
MAYCPNLGSDPDLFEAYSYDRESNTYTLQNPPTPDRLRSHPFPSYLYIGEGCRGLNDPIIEFLRGVRIDPSPYLKRIPVRAVSPCSPDRGFDGSRRAGRASPAWGPPPPPALPRARGMPPAMGLTALMAAPLVGPRGPAPAPLGAPLPPPGFGPPPYRGPQAYILLNLLPESRFRGVIPRLLISGPLSLRVPLPRLSNSSHRGRAGCLTFGLWSRSLSLRPV